MGTGRRFRQLFSSARLGNFPNRKDLPDHTAAQPGSENATDDMSQVKQQHQQHKFREYLLHLTRIKYKKSLNYKMIYERQQSQLSTPCDLTKDEK